MLSSKRLLALVLSCLAIASPTARAQPSVPAPSAPAPSAPAPSAPAPSAPAPSAPAEPSPDAPREGAPQAPAATESGDGLSEGRDGSAEADAGESTTDDEEISIDVPVTAAPSSDATDDEELEVDSTTTAEGSTGEESLPDTLVVGRRAQDLDRVPGAVNVVNERQLQQQAPFNANEVMRRIPGVTVRDEEGVGLRANIGIRGLNSDRSRNVLVLEDGIPVQVMPYTYPELYYTPRIDRMRSVEVVKGSGSVLFGPQTVAGVVNFVSLDPPDELNVRANIEYGSFNSLVASASVGDTVGRVGYLFHATHFRFDGNRHQDAAVTDLMGKLRIDMGRAGVLRLKLQAYFEDSASTYLGLTTQQFETNPAFNFARNDELAINRFAATLSHAIDLGDHVDLLTTAYASQTSRDWGRQRFDRVSKLNDQTGVGTDPITGQSFTYERVINGLGQNILSQPNWPSDTSAVFFRNQRDIINRDFRVAGLESRATYRFRGFGERHRLVGGMRVHYEDATTQTMVGDTPTAKSGDRLADYENRGIAFAAYAQLRLGFLRDRLEVTPGFRVESLWTKNTTYQNLIAPGVDQVLPPSSMTTVAPIPGVGASFAANEHVTVYGGVHRGFAPPRIYDAITSTGVLHAKPQFSWNYEIGTRLAWSDVFHADVSGFVLAFDNQAITPTEAMPGTNSDGEAISGPTRSIGVEVSSTYDLAKHAHQRFGLPITVAYAYIDARTVGTSWDSIYRDVFLPYVPKHHVNVVLGFTHRLGIEAQIDGDYQTYQYSDLRETVEADPSGTIGLVPSRFLLNARVAYHHRRTGLTFYVTAKNLLDARYIASRAQSGIQPGMFRQLMGGVSLDY